MLTYTEEQALGYMVKALRDLGKSEKEIKKIIYQVMDVMEVWTEEYAEGVYEEFI